MGRPLHIIKTRRKAKASIYFYIEMFYNSRRRHATIGYLSPNQFEAKQARINLSTQCPPTVGHLRAPRQCKLDGDAEAVLIATACTKSPAGHSRWTVRLLADKLVELGVVESCSHMTVQRAMKKTS